MKTTLKEDIAKANRVAQSTRNRQFVKRSTDAQMLEHLIKCIDVAITAYRDEYRKGLTLPRNLHEALRELDAARNLAKKRMK